MSARSTDIIRTSLRLPSTDALFQATCRCGITFGLIELAEALELDEYRPRYCPFCGSRAAVYTRSFGRVIDS